jgi:hypothetical protein
MASRQPFNIYFMGMGDLNAYTTELQARFELQG